MCSCTFSYIKGEDEAPAKETQISTTNKVAKKKSPNFIVIFADDMGYGDVASFGNPNIRTPNLDRMGVEGQKWTQFYSADPVCTPSRAGLLTGRYPIRNGMTSKARGVLFPDSDGGLPQDEITIAEMLKQKNYATACIGKWHLGHLPQHLPTTQGFDYYWGIPYSNDMDAVPGSKYYREESLDDPAFYAKISTYQVPLIENKTEIERPADQTNITRRYTEKAVEFIKANKDNPFFLYLPHSMPHIPLFAGEAFYGKSPRGHYGDVIEEIDWSVGEVMKTVESLGIDDNTLIVFTSDNGPWLLFRSHGGSAGPLRAGKGTHFEGGQRVPTFFWGPNFVSPGVVHDMGSTIDLMATFASIANVSLPQDRKMDGYDLSRVLAGQKFSPRKEFFYWGYGELAGVRAGKYKLHIKEVEPVVYWNKVEMDRPKLYDLETDIGEKFDLYEAMPDKVKELQMMIEDHLADTEDSLPDNLASRIEK